MTTIKIVEKFLKEWAPRKVIEAESDKKTKEDQEHHHEEEEEVSTSSSSSSSPKLTGKSCLLVVSSNSGFGNAARLTPKVAKALAAQPAFDRVVVVPSQHCGHVREIVQSEPKLAETYSVIVVLGGDGAFSEAVNGLLTRSDNASKIIPLAHCPGGSGCSTSGNTLGCWKGTEAEKACDIIGKMKTNKIDIVQVECNQKTYYSHSCVTGGFNTDIIDLADKHYKWTYRWFGPTFRYILGLFRAMISYGKQDCNRLVKFTINEGTETENVFESTALGIAVYNCGRVMEDSRFARATLTSGNMDLVLATGYPGFGTYLKYVGDLQKHNGELTVENNVSQDVLDIHFAKTSISSVRVEPVVMVEGNNDDKNNNQNKNTARPTKVAMDGEKGANNDDFMTAPFSAKILPAHLNVVFA